MHYKMRTRLENAVFLNVSINGATPVCFSRVFLASMLTNHQKQNH